MRKSSLLRILFSSIIIITISLCMYSFYRVEGFNSIQNAISQLKAIQQEQNAYPLWVGWLYKNPSQNAAVLNDFKARVFQPNCMFRKDWSETLPAGMNKPLPPQNELIATLSYKAYLACLAKGKNYCIDQLNDAKRRFMEPDCQFLNPSNPAHYTNNSSPPFK